MRLLIFSGVLLLSGCWTLLAEPQPICGNDQIWPDEEECDDGNVENGDGCDSLCQIEECGNGRVDAAREFDGPVPRWVRLAGLIEECDAGNDNNNDACTNRCQIARCGDGLMREDLTEDQEGYEECDDGNDNNNDECTNGCKVER